MSEINRENITFWLENVFLIFIESRYRISPNREPIILLVIFGICKQLTIFLYFLDIIVDWDIIHYVLRLYMWMKHDTKDIYEICYVGKSNQLENKTIAFFKKFLNAIWKMPTRCFSTSWWRRNLHMLMQYIWIIFITWIYLQYTDNDIPKLS